MIGVWCAVYGVRQLRFRNNSFIVCWTQSRCTQAVCTICSYHLTVVYCVLECFFFGCWFSYCCAVVVVLTFAQNHRYDMAINKLVKKRKKKKQSALPFIHGNWKLSATNQWHDTDYMCHPVESILRVQRQCTFKNIITNKPIAVCMIRISTFSSSSLFPTVASNSMSSLPIKWTLQHLVT